MSTPEIPAMDGPALAKRILFLSRTSRVVSIALITLYVCALVLMFPNTSIFMAFALLLAVIGAGFFFRKKQGETAALLNALMLDNCDPADYARGIELLAGTYRKGGAAHTNALLSLAQARQLMGDHDGARGILEKLDPSTLPSMLKIIFYSLSGRDKLQAGDRNGAINCRNSVLEMRPQSPAEQALADNWQLILQMQILLKENRFPEARTLTGILQPQMKAKMQKVTFAFSMARLYLGEANQRAARGELNYVIMNGGTLGCVQEARDMLERLSNIE